MSYRIDIHGNIYCDTAQEAVNIARIQREEAKEREAVKRRPIEPTGDFERELRAICDAIPSPSHDGRGPKEISKPDVLYACALKVYRGLPARTSPEGGPHYNTVLIHTGSPKFTQYIEHAIRDARRKLGAGNIERPITWAPIASKAPVAQKNEKLLRNLCEIVAAIVGEA